MSLKSTVRQKQDGRYVTTLPKRFGDRYELDGTPVAFRVDSRDKLSVIFSPGTDEKASYVHHDSRGQYTVNVWTGLGAAMNLDGATLEWDDPTTSRLTAKVISRGDVDDE